MPHPVGGFVCVGVFHAASRIEFSRHLISNLICETICADLNRKVGIIGMRREDFALVTGSDFRHHLILYEEECLKTRRVFLLMSLEDSNIQTPTHRFIFLE